jgi:predicted deacylase
MSEEVFKIQDLEVYKGEKIKGYLKISEKPAGKYQIPIMIFHGSRKGPVLLINGGEHGSEYNGPGACLRLMTELDAKMINGVVVIVPIVNTLAFEARWMHSNPVDYRDLSRCYVPEIPQGGSGHPLLSYQIAKVFYEEVISKADYRLNLHGGDLEEDLNETITYRKTGTDKKRDEMGLALARNFGLKYIRESLPRPGRKPSSLKMPITIITEAGGMGRCQHDIIDRTYKGCINVMKYLKMIPGAPEIPPSAIVYNTYAIYAKRGGFFISHVRAGDEITKGEKIGVIKDLFGEILEEIIAPTDGVVDMIFSPAIYEGDYLIGIGKNIRTIT